MHAYATMQVIEGRRSGHVETLGGLSRDEAESFPPAFHFSRLISHHLVLDFYKHCLGTLNLWKGGR